MKHLTIWMLLFVCVFSLSAEPRDRAEVEREIDLLNAILTLENASWKAGMTSMSLLSDEDIQQSLGLIEPKLAREEFVFNAAQWPSPGQEVLVPNVTPVRNQKSCGSCVAFGTTAAFEQAYRAKNGETKYFSERYLFFCSPYKGYGCNGGWSLDGGAVAASNSRKGMIESNNCPYVVNGQYYYDCGSGCNSNVQKYTMSYEEISSNSYISVMNQGRVVIIGMQVYADFRDYKSGVYEHLSGGRLGGHCMALVGYGTTRDGKNYWVVKNSWDTTWGDQGYIRILCKSQQKNKDSNIEDYGGYYFE
jgi:C1A family cysteine protease